MLCIINLTRREKKSSRSLPQREGKPSSPSCMTALPILNPSSAACRTKVHSRCYCDHRIESLQQLVEDGISTFSLDVCSQASVSACMAEVTKQTHAIDILINNAGIATEHIFEHQDHGLYSPEQ